MVLNAQKGAFMNTNEEYYNQTFRLVGVTFDNKDGTNRQKLLEDIKLFHGSNGVDYQKGELKLELVKYKFEGEDAICLKAGMFKDILGNISRKDLPFLLENYDYIYDIPYLDISGGTPRGCTITVTFKNPNYIPPAPIVKDTVIEEPKVIEPQSKEKPKNKTGFFTKLFKKK